MKSKSTCKARLTLRSDALSFRLFHFGIPHKTITPSAPAGASKLPYASFVAYISALIHSLQSGTDSPLLAVQIIYAVTALVVVFLFVYRILMALFPSRESRSA